MGAWVLFAKLCWQFDGLLVLIQDADLDMFVSEELNVTKIKSAALMEVTRSLTQSITHTHKHTYIQTQAHRHMQAHLYDFAHKYVPQPLTRYPLAQVPGDRVLTDNFQILLHADGYFFILILFFNFRQARGECRDD